MARRRGYRRKSAKYPAGAIVVAVVLTTVAVYQNPALGLPLLGGLIALLCGFVLVVILPRLSRNEHSFVPSQGAFDDSRWSLDLIKRLDWRRFEELCAWYFEESGYNTKVSNFGPDSGIDIYVHDPAGTVSGIVQCKAWTNREVGVKEVRELFGVMHDVGCPNGVFVALSGFTPEARAFAKNKSIDLVSAEQLLDLIAVLPAEAQARLLKKTTSGDYTTPSCPSCGIKLALRTANRTGKQFWGCTGYPKCRYIMNLPSSG